MLKYIKHYNSLDEFNIDVFYDNNPLPDDSTPFVALCDGYDVTYSPGVGMESNGYTFVDLGLPSGTLWATGNMGRYCWGRWDNSGNPSSNYVEPQLRINENDEYFCIEDPAQILRGGDWRLPTVEQFEELYAYTTYSKVITNSSLGVFTSTFTSTINGNSVDFGYCGIYFNNSMLSNSSHPHWTCQITGPGGSGIAYNIIKDNAEEAKCLQTTKNQCMMRPVIVPKRIWYNKPEPPAVVA